MSIPAPRAESPGPLAPTRSPAARLIPWALAGGAALRLVHWWIVRELPFFGQLAMDSAEYDRWARAIAAGDWFGSEPFFQAPLYPYLLALLYRGFGAGPDAVYLAQIACALVGGAALASAATRALSAAHGLATALLWATYPVFLFADVQVGKESLAVALVALFLERLLAARASGRPATWAAVGALGGALVLLRENALLVVPPLVLYAGRIGAPRRANLGRALAAGLAFVAVLAPVAWRNAALGGGFLPTTSQGGANYWIGNSPEADGTYRPLVPGRQVPELERAAPERLAERALGRQLSASEVSRYWFGRSFAWAADEPIAFARLQLRKLRLFFDPYEWPDAVDFAWVRARSWPLRVGFDFLSIAILGLAGFALGRRRFDDTLGPILAFVALWTLSVVAFFVFSRYRLPVVPALLLLASVPIVDCAAALRRRRIGESVVLATLLAALWVAPRLDPPAIRQDLVAYNLGRLAEERGDLAAAEVEYRAAVAADPRAFLPEMNLGRLAARRGDFAGARARFVRAVELEPGSPEALANLGAAELALGELERARLALERALALDPDYPPARSNLELVDRLLSERTR